MGWKEGRKGLFPLFSLGLFYDFLSLLPPPSFNPLADEAKREIEVASKIFLCVCVGRVLVFSSSSIEEEIAVFAVQ